MFVFLNDMNRTLVNINDIRRMSLVQVVKGASPVWKGAIDLVDDNHTIWFDGDEYERVRLEVMGYGNPKVSNDLKETKQIQPKVTARRGKQHDRIYHKPAQIPELHVFDGGDTALSIYNLCRICLLPHRHPVHNASNPIEEKSDANQPKESPTR